MANVMSRPFLTWYFVGLSIISNGQTNEDAKAFYVKAMSEINPKHVQWIKSKAAETDVSAQGISNLRMAAQNYLNASKVAAVDPNALVQLVLRESYLQTTEDLRFYAEKVKYFNECKKKVREYLQELRDYDAKMRPISRSLYDSIKTFSSSIKLDMTPPGNPNFNRTSVKKDSLTTQTINPPINRRQVTKPVSADEITNLIEELEQKARALDQSSEELSLRMQLLMERARQADSMLANIFKQNAEARNIIIANLK